MEIELNGAKLRVYEDGKIEIFKKRSWNSKEHWYELKGWINIEKCGYKQHRIRFYKKDYNVSRVIYFAFNPTWDITDISINNTIDHINRDSLDNRLSNLRVANAKEQSNNRKKRSYNVNAKGYTFDISRNKWLAQIQINEKCKYLGRFDTEEEAHQAYQDAKSTHISYII